MTLTLTAHIYAKQDTVSSVKEVLTALVNPTRAEEGCVQYDLHQDKENATHFMFFEKWNSREQLDEHIKTSHFKSFQKDIKGLVERMEFYEMDKVA